MKPAIFKGMSEFQVYRLASLLMNSLHKKVCNALPLKSRKVADLFCGRDMLTLLLQN